MTTTTQHEKDKAALDMLDSAETRLPSLEAGTGTLEVQRVRCFKSFGTPAKPGDDCYAFDFRVKANIPGAGNKPGTMCTRLIKIAGQYPEPKLREVKTILSCWFGRQLSRDDLAAIRRGASAEATEADLRFFPVGREVHFVAKKEFARDKTEFLKVEWSAAPVDALQAAVEDL